MEPSWSEIGVLLKEHKWVLREDRSNMKLFVRGPERIVVLSMKNSWTVTHIQNEDVRYERELDGEFAAKTVALNVGSAKIIE